MKYLKMSALITLLSVLILPSLGSEVISATLVRLDFGFPFQFVSVYAVPNGSMLLPHLFAADTNISFDVLTFIINMAIFYYLALRLLTWKKK